MLLQLENTNQDNIKKLIAFVRQNHLKLSLIDEGQHNYLLPGKPLTQKQLTALIESSRKSSIISMQDAHQIISSKF